MNWKLRHQGSPKTISGLDPQRIAEGLLDGQWELTDEVLSPGSEIWTPIENHPQFAEVVEDLEPPPPKPHDDETNLDMTPLIDVCQVLLIFFILTTTYNQMRLMIPLPRAAAGEKSKVARTKEEVKETSVILTISMSASGDPVLQIENELFTLDDAEGILERWRKAANRTTLAIQAAPNVPHGVVIAIQDKAKSAGMEGVTYLVPAK